MNKFFTKDHEWVSIGEDGIGTVGITDHATDALGDIVFVELPTVGADIVVGDSVVVVESVKAASDVYSPVSGKIIEVNEELFDNPAIVNEYPEENGWLFKIELSDTSEVENLLSAEQYANILSD